MSEINLATGYAELLNHSVLRSDSLVFILGQNTTSQCCASGTCDFAG